MNKTNFVQTGGWPLNAERLEELETAYSVFNAFGALAGDLSIISGCVTVGSTVGDGFVYIAGELLAFKTGAVTPTSSVIIIEEKVNRAFESTDVKTVHTIRYATFGTAETSWLWSSFKQLDPIVSMMAKIQELEKKSAVFQLGGGMVFWNKPAAQIPAGWQEVVAWKGRIPVGLDTAQPEFNSMGKQGGNKNKSLSIAELPAHFFTYLKAVTGRGYKTASDDNPLTGTTSAQTNTIGSDQAFSIMNPYRVVLFIEYIG